MTDVVYDVHGVKLLVQSNEPRVLESVDSRLRWFRTVDAPPIPDQVISVRTAVEPGQLHRQPLGDCRAVYDTPVGPVFYHEPVDTLWLDYRGWASLLIEPRTGRTRMCSLATGAEAVWLLSHPLLTIALAETLKRCGRYALHAAAMAPAGGDVVLLAGGSGAGKTTLSLGLLLKGWRFLADDTVFLKRDDAGLTVLGFADEVDVADESVALVPELERTLGPPSVAGRGKRPVIVEDAFGIKPVTAGRPVAIVLLTVAHQPRSVLTRLDPGQALVELAPNVLLTEPISSQAHFDALAELVVAVPCWRLETGRDFRQVGEMLADLG